MNCLLSTSLPLLLQCLLLTMVTTASGPTLYSQILWENMLLVLRQWWLILLHYPAASLTIYLMSSPSVHLWQLVGLSQGPCLLSSYCTRKGCLLLTPKASEASWGLSISNQGFQVVTVVWEKEVTVMECAIWGSSEMCQIWVLGSHFWRLWVTVDFDDGSFKKYGQFII